MNYIDIARNLFGASDGHIKRCNKIIGKILESLDDYQPKRDKVIFYFKKIINVGCLKKMLM